MRQEIEVFARAMEEIMLINDIEKGDSWEDCDYDFLLKKLIEEFVEVMRADGRYSDMAIMRLVSDGLMYHKTKSDKKEKELVDLANVSMMLWHRERKGEGGA